MQVYPGEELSAVDILTRQTLSEVSLALQERELCTSTRPVDPALASLGLSPDQVISACTTCSTERGVPVGVCTICALRCHESHELVELGTRRQFACDCVGGGGCTAGGRPPPAGAVPNVYGHNFEGRFCKCDAPYDPARDTLVQCVVCCDWLHDHHVKGYLPLEEWGGFVCGGCVSAHPFLSRFAAVGGVCTATGADSPHVLQPWRCCLTCSGGVDDGRGVCGRCAEVCHVGHVLGPPRISMFACDCGTPELPGTLCIGRGGEVVAARPKWCAAVDAAAAPPASSPAAGPTDAPVAPVAAPTTPALFLETTDDLVELLCACPACLPVLARAGLAAMVLGGGVGVEPDVGARALDGVVPELIDLYDQNSRASAGKGGSVGGPTSFAGVGSKRPRDEGGAAAPPFVPLVPTDGQAADFDALLGRLTAEGHRSQHDLGMEALRSLPAETQRNMLVGYGQLKDGLFSFLRGFSERGEVVTEDKVREFFAAATGGGGGAGR